MKNILSFFSPDGPRLNRAKYIQYILLTLLTAFLLYFCTRYTIFFLFEWEKLAIQLYEFVLRPIWFILMFLIIFSFHARRNHDRGLSSWPRRGFWNFYMPGTKWPNKYWPDPLEQKKNS